MIGAGIGSIWCLSRSLIRTSHRGWTVLFASYIILLAVSGIGLALIHAPYHLRTADHIVFRATIVAALAFTCWYVFGERFLATNR